MAREDLIDIDQLKVGMFIHLDLGWMRHPFPLSNFRLSSPDQIAVLRKLGLKQVRWSPALSQIAVEESKSAEPAKAEALSAEQLALEARREALRREREALAQCEAQYAEATRAMAEVQAEALRRPPKAGELAKMLSQSLLDKMLIEGDVSLRLLTEAAGDRACAHGLNVALISMLLARSAGTGNADLLALGTGALLHDIGKLEVDPRLRFRSEQFSAAELAGYQWHVAKGMEIGQRMGVDAGTLAVIAQHHEHVDGSGFPQKLSGERQHPLARVVALVNRFDGLVNPAVPTAKSLTPHEALSLMFAQGRSRFDATLLNAFIRMMGVYPPGSAVQLTDERYALVVAVNANRPLKPTVLVYDAKVPARDALVTSLEDQPSLGIRRSLRPAELPEGARNYLRPRQRVAYFPHGGRSGSDGRHELMALVFRSKAGADVLMLQADAERVLRALGREPAPQGVVLPEQVDALLQQFAAHQEPAAAPDAEGDEPDEASPDLARRAWPLLQLMQAARDRGVPVTWSPA